ncbi:cytochrome c-type biogenesis protein [Azospirillum sp.]|uniref:cytochrome c-type biogenesis protein n=1 Tax=Azospirillum sp. TaxID=34012 RepID=UPI003D7135D3
MKRLLFAVLLLVLPASAGAVMPDEVLKDPTLELRARGISKDLRCLVCQNQSIDDSDAPLARDLRVIVRERLSAGDSDADVVRFLTDRYGDYVLLKPPVKATTVALWTAPAVLLLLALLAARPLLRRRAAEAAPAPLSEAEQARLHQILSNGGQA